MPIFPTGYDENTSPTTSDKILIADVSNSNKTEWTEVWNLPFSTIEQARLDEKMDKVFIEAINAQSTVTYVSWFTATLAQQGIISDGTYVYAISSDLCIKFNEAWTEITRRTITTDVPSQTHKWDGCYYDWILYIGSGYYALWEVGAILKLNASDLSVNGYVLTEWGHDVSAIARKSDWTFWCASYNTPLAPKIYRYSSTLWYEDEFSLESIHGTYAYDGLEWDGDFLLANAHNWITGNEYIFKYYFDWTQFILVQKIPHLLNSQQCGQGISFNPSNHSILWMCSQTDNRLIKTTYASTSESFFTGVAKLEWGNIFEWSQNFDSNTLYVDATNNRIGVGLTNPNDLVSIMGANSTIPSLWGTSVTKLGLYNVFGWNPWYWMIFWVLGSWKGFIQEQRVDGTATSYDLLLQPNGGNVGIWTSSSTKNLEVSWASNTQILATNTTTGEAQFALKSGTSPTVITHYYRNSDDTYWIYDGSVTFLRWNWPNHWTYPRTVSITDISAWQNVACAMLTVQSTTKWFLPPKMTTTQKNAITWPVAWLIVHDTDLNKLQHYAGAWYHILDSRQVTLDATNTAGGTTGDRTINKPSGTVNIAAAWTTVTVTNSLVTTSSIVLTNLRTNDATATIKNVVPWSGSFVITLWAAATAEVSIWFLVIN